MPLRPGVGGRAKEKGILWLALVLPARLLGRLASVADGSTGPPCGTPNDKRLTLVVDDLAAGEALSILEDRAVLVLNLFRELLLRIVILAGTELPVIDESRGEARGVMLFLGVPLVDGGSFERTEWTLSSIFCILPIRPLIWYNEPDLGRPSEGTLANLDIGAVLPLLAEVDEAKDGPRI